MKKMFNEEIISFLICVLPQVLATSCMPKCGIPSDWLPVASNICYGTKGDNFTKFTMNRNCDLFAIRFTHVSGFQNWYKSYVSHRSRWGSRSNAPTRICALLLKNRKLFIPRKVDDESYAYYFLDGFKVDDDVIVLKQNETLSTGEEFEVAFCFDFKDQYESDSEGTHCVDVDVSCYV